MRIKDKENNVNYLNFGSIEEVKDQDYYNTWAVKLSTSLLLYIIARKKL